MRILITGNLGYVGSCLCPFLRMKYPKAYLAGYDLGLFQHCLTADACSSDHILDVQFYGDVRKFDEQLLAGFDHVIHLAAISNDPIGNKFSRVTDEVNAKATVDIAGKAARMGVRSFVFASSCSVYGAGGDDAKTESSPINPLTAYARSKVMAELGLAENADEDMIITSLRFATACGMSDRLRLDLVLNDFVASAVTTKKIDIMSDGSPWRPLINVKDMARAMDWALHRTVAQGGKFLICNTGSNGWNYTVRELAMHVQQNFEDLEVRIHDTSPADKRSYKVNFDLFSTYANGGAPLYDIGETILEIKEGLQGIDFNDANFRDSKLMRLNVLNGFLKAGKLNENLNWIPSAS